VMMFGDEFNWIPHYFHLSHPNFEMS
jgi:hypothetical protein